MLTRDDIIDYSVRMGCNQDLLNKGMATTPFGDVFCIATLSGETCFLLNFLYKYIAKEIANKISIVNRIVL